MSNVPTQQPDGQNLPPTGEGMNLPLDAMEQVNPLLPTLEEQRQIIDGAVAQGHLNWLKGQGQEGNQRYLYPNDPNTSQERVFFMPPQTIFWVRDQLELGTSITPQNLYDKLMADTLALGEDYAFLPARYEKFKADFVATEDAPVVLDEAQQVVFENFLQDVVKDGIKSNELYGKATVDLLNRILDKKNDPKDLLADLQMLQVAVELIRESDTIGSLVTKFSRTMGGRVKEILISAHKHWREIRFPTESRTAEGVAEIGKSSPVYEIDELENPTVESIMDIVNSYRGRMHNNSNFTEHETFNVMLVIGDYLEKLSQNPESKHAGVYEAASKKLLGIILYDANPVIIESTIKFIKEKRSYLMPES